MNHIQYISTAVAVSLVAATSVSFAATGAVVASTGTTAGSTVVTATGVTAGGVAVGTGATTTTTTLEVKSAPRLTKKTANSVTLEWDKVSGASAYIVKYSKISIATSKDPNAQYDNESDQITATGVTIEKLSSTNEKLAANTAYYFSVVAVDSVGKESDSFSDELMVTTDADATVATTATSSLAVASVNVIDDRTVSVVFNANLSDDALKAKIVKTSDNSDIAVQTIIKDLTNPKAATITLGASLVPVSAYTLTVISAKDAAGNNIQEGVNGLKEFTSPEKMAVAAGTVATEASGATLSGSTTDTTTATKVATGAQENLLILAALILSVGIAYIYRRKFV